MQPAENHEAPACPSGQILGSHVLRFRVRYSETDQMGTFYNSRPLEWFECGRTELLRHFGLTYTSLEHRGVFLPLVEAGVRYVGRARYDDLLAMTTTLSLAGRARLRCDVSAQHAESAAPVVTGFTVHAFADASGKAVRPPPWFLATWRHPASTDFIADSLQPNLNSNPK